MLIYQFPTYKTGGGILARGRKAASFRSCSWRVRLGWSLWRVWGGRSPLALRIERWIEKKRRRRRRKGASVRSSPRDLLVNRDREPLGGAQQRGRAVFHRTESPRVVDRRKFRPHAPNRLWISPNMTAFKRLVPRSPEGSGTPASDSMYIYIYM